MTKTVKNGTEAELPGALCLVQSAGAGRPEVSGKHRVSPAPRPEGAEARVCRYSAGKMVVRGPRGVGAVVLTAAQRVRGLVRRQFLTRNRRLAFVLAIVGVAIGAAAV